MAKALYGEPAVVETFSSALLGELIARLPDGISIDVRIRPDGSRYYRAECVGLSWDKDTMEELAAEVFKTVTSPRAKSASHAGQPIVIEDTASPLDIIDTIEAARISGMTRHQIRAAVVRGKLRQAEGMPPVSLIRGEVLEWVKIERNKDA